MDNSHRGMMQTSLEFRRMIEPPDSSAFLLGVDDLAEPFDGVGQVVRSSLRRWNDRGEEHSACGGDGFLE